MLDLLFDIIIAIIIAVPCGTLHEYLHVREAIKLGYQANVNFRRNETEIDVPSGSPDAKKIARAPYKVMIPLSLFLIFLGYYINFGILIAGVCVLFLHIISYPLEGRDIEKGSIIEDD